MSDAPQTIASYESEFGVDGETIRIVVDIIIKPVDDKYKQTDIVGQVWVNGTRVHDADVISSGPEMGNISFPSDHPVTENYTRERLVEGDTSESVVQEQREATIVEVPSEFGEQIRKEERAALGELRAKGQRPTLSEIED